MPKPPWPRARPIRYCSCRVVRGGRSSRLFTGRLKGDPHFGQTGLPESSSMQLTQMVSSFVAFGSLPLSGPLDTDPSCATSGVPSAYQDDCDIPAQAVENAVAMGLTVVAAAGNDAQSSYQGEALNSIDSPGTAP